MSMLEHALSYASDGFAVLPLHKPHAGGCSCGKHLCESAGKHPLAAAVPHGKDDATTDPAKVTAWWTRWSTANIGIQPPNEVVVLDVDPRHHGDNTLLQLVGANEPLPETLVAHTGSGGLHYWFTSPTVTVGRLGPGLDVKTSRGYLVAPPSVHASGGIYRWLTDAPIAPAPAWVRRLLAPVRPRSPRTVGPVRGGTGAGLVRTVAEAQNGQRNDLLWWAAKKAFDNGADPALLEQVRQAAIGNGLTEHEVDATMRSAERWATGGGRK